MNDTNHPLDQYVTDLLATKQIPDTPEDHAKLLHEVDSYIDDALMEAMPDSALVALDEATDDAISSTMIEDLLKEAGVDPAKVMSEALTRFKAEYEERSK